MQQPHSTDFETERCGLRPAESYFVVLCEGGGFANVVETSDVLATNLLSDIAGLMVHKVEVS